ncbi:MAG: hypothetical protein ACK4VY_12190 [Brevundimonas sp.]
MRRFFIWSALAAVIGLILAGGAYWAYWNYYSRFQPVTVSRNQVEIQRLLDEASWVSAGGGGEPLYIIGYRDSAAMARYEREEVPKLRAAGIEPRFILFARPDREGLAQSTAAERATIAELWLTRDWTLYQRWTATPVRNWTAAGIPAADGSLARGAVVEAGRDFVARLTADLGEAGLQPGYPLIIWRDREGFMKACACTDSRSWVFIRDDLDAPDRIDASAAPGEPQPAPPAPGVEGTGSLPYPTLPPLTAPNGTAPGATPTPAPAAPATPPPVRQPPEAKQNDDTTFF